jgi:hypothetical protein
MLSAARLNHVLVGTNDVINWNPCAINWLAFSTSEAMTPGALPVDRTF